VLGSEHIDFSSYAFMDLIQLAKHDNQVLKELYYNRSDECNRFCAILENIISSGDNVLIVGDAGIGKSNFIYKIALDDSLTIKYNIYPIIIDYREITPRSVDSCLIKFIDSIEEYCNNIKETINNLKANTKDNIIQNFHIISKHITLIASKPSRKHLVVFLDDLDYAENDWYQLLEYFLPLANSPFISMVLTVRPNLLAAINGFDDRFSYYFARNVKKIELHPLQVKYILATRLAPVLIENENVPFYQYIKTFFKRDNSVSKVIKKLGVKKLDDLTRFEYPFTEKHNNFMRLITNGNIRGIFEIAFESLLFISKNKLESIYEEGAERKVIGREGTLLMLYDNAESRYKIIDINKHKNKKGNSLLYNVLEAVKIIPMINDRFYETVKKLNHSKETIDWALEFLSDKSNRMIVPIKCYTPEIKQKLQLYDEYELTEKGQFYLDMAKWEEYKRRCGLYGKSLIESIQI